MKGNSVVNFEKVWVFMKWLLVWCTISAVSFGGCSYFNAKMGLEADHPAEEYAEDLIEDHFGLPDDFLDFTPE